MQVLAALFLLIPFCYLSGSFTLSPVAEEASKARHLQLLSGCPPFIYWAGSYVSAQPCSHLHHAHLPHGFLPHTKKPSVQLFCGCPACRAAPPGTGNDRSSDVQIWDLMTYAMVVVLSLLVFAAYDDRATTGSLQQLLGTFLLLLLYGAAVIPLGYAYSFGFSSPSAAQAGSFSLSPPATQACLHAKSLWHVGSPLSPTQYLPCTTEIAMSTPGRVKITVRSVQRRMAACRCRWQRCPSCWASWP